MGSGFRDGSEEHSQLTMRRLPNALSAKTPIKCSRLAFWVATFSSSVFASSRHLDSREPRVSMLLNQT